MVVLLYPNILNFTFQNVKILRFKIFLINFLDELGNLKQKKFYTSKCKIFLHFKATDPLYLSFYCLLRKKFSEFTELESALQKLASSFKCTFFIKSLCLYFQVEFLENKP